MKLTTLRLSLFLLLLISLFAPMGMGEPRARSVRIFAFATRFQRPPQAPGTVTLHKGTTLQPINPNDRRLIYQSLVLCNDVELHFDANGLSQLADIKGFCYNMGLPIPPDYV